MEYLAFLIDEEVVKHNWTSIKVGRGSMLLTHLFFGADLILMAEATNGNCESIVCPK